jgi:cholesterol oxidase
MSAELFDAVIVGSGFGGSVMARNLSEAKMKVCVLERGKFYAPGDFGRTPDQLKESLWYPPKGLFGLFNIQSFRDFDAVVSSGVGGGSLIYANVMLRKDPSWFNSDKWPINYEELEKHYERVEAVLRPTPYPSHLSPYNETPKHTALKEAQVATELKFEPIKLAISFGKDPNKPVPGEELADDRNLHNTKRYGCRLCGECYLGCNFGSKNTLDFNFLSMAKRAGAEIRALSEVVSIACKSDGEGYRVEYMSLERQAKGHAATSGLETICRIECKYLILSAGTFGTTKLMLENKSNFPKVSSMLGKSFSGNGDIFTTADACRSKVNGKDEMLNLKPYLGPTITGALKSDSPDRTKRFYIEDWSYPITFIWFLQTMHIGTFLRRWWQLIANYLEIKIGFRINTDIGYDASRLVSDRDSAVYSFPMVGMGMARADGRMTLKRGNLEVDYPRSSSGAFFSNVQEKMRKIARLLRAKSFMELPTWYLDKTITVHPLGGCPMGFDESTGVVDKTGEVFNYPNFFIADGSVIPDSIGPNPSLTIAAVSDLFSETIVNRWNGSAHQKTQMVVAKAGSSAKRISKTSNSNGEEIQ